MTNYKANHLLRVGLHPVLLGSRGDGLKRPLHKRWQTAVYQPGDVAHWPAENNVGIRCGAQRDGRALIVFDFDAEARRIFPSWSWQMSQWLRQPPVVVSSGRGYHVYFFLEEADAGRTLAGRYTPVTTPDDGRRRLVKFIETLGTGRQVVSAGSRHPSGRKYHFCRGAGYGDIPTLTRLQYKAMLTLSRSYDERPKWQMAVGAAAAEGDAAPHTPGSQTTIPSAPGSAPEGIRDCLAYARRFMGTTEQVESNGDIRFLGYGGLLVTANGRGWYSFSEQAGGGLAELVAWHQAQ
jgi:hypothetical protein